MERLSKDLKTMTDKFNASQSKHEKESLKTMLLKFLDRVLSGG